MTARRFLLSILVFMFASLIVAAIGGASLFEAMEVNRERANRRRPNPA